MNYKLNVNGGGIFSKYMLCIQNLSKMDFNSIYLNVTDNRTYNDIFDSILNQTLNESYKDITCNHIPVYNSYNNKIEFSNNFINYKRIVKTFNFKQELLEKVNFFLKKLNITENTIGIHIRLTDMNVLHKFDHGCNTFDDYLKFFNHNSDFFVASDNEESIEKLKNIFGDRIKYIPNFIRGKTESENTFDLQLSNFYSPIFWQEAFIEMFILSKCGSLICRTSNLSNASIIHSETIKNVIRI